MLYRLTCPCGTAFEVDERAIGKHFKCAGCRRRIQVDQVILQEVSVFRLACECGAAFRVEDRAIGGTFQCPYCGRAVEIDQERLTAVPSQDRHVPKAPRESVPVDFPGGAPSPS